MRDERRIIDRRDGVAIFKKKVVTQEETCVNIEADDMRAFLLVVRQALLMIVRFIDKRYNLTT